MDRRIHQNPVVKTLVAQMVVAVLAATLEIVAAVVVKMDAAVLLLTAVLIRENSNSLRFLIVFRKSVYYKLIPALKGQK
ncbi:MAG: hypothetical protein CMM44_04995 [Rhodospirillaceae bacterium]|nr:hypothetical protein [Rhodospirillaceae bacterium]